MAIGSYLQFDDNNIQYIYIYITSRRQKNGTAEYKQLQTLHKDNWKK